MNILMRWFVVLRGYAWPASIAPISIAAAYSYKRGWFNFYDFLVIFVAGLLIHTSGNLINTYYDFVNGIDKDDADDIGIVKNLVKPSTVIKLAWLLLAIGCVLGIYLVFKYSLYSFLIIGVVGVALTVAYTANPFSLKYKAIGELVIFLCFGPLIVSGSVMIFAKRFIMESVIYSLPTAFLIVNLLLSNNIRDYSSDKKSGIKTIVDVFGIKKSEILYILLHILSYVVALWILKLSYATFAFFICIPLSIRIFTLLKRQEYSALNRESAKFILFFGLIFISAILWG
ncbi:MAG: prenyltransferase [Elusimicrobiales bacterium]